MADMPNPIPQALKEAACRKAHAVTKHGTAQYSWEKGSFSYALCELLWQNGWREPVDPPKTMTITLTEAEMQVLKQLAEKQELTPTGVLRQALRLYQLVDAELVTVKRTRELERQGNDG